LLDGEDGESAAAGWAQVGECFGGGRGRARVAQ